MHGLESWLRHPPSTTPRLLRRGPAAWRDLGEMCDLFLKRVERLEARSSAQERSKMSNLEAVKSQVKRDEQALRTKEHQDQATHKTHTRHNAKPGKLVATANRSSTRSSTGRTSPEICSTNSDHAAPRKS